MLLLQGLMSLVFSLASGLLESEMTDAEWQSSGDVAAMMAWLESEAIHLVTGRKQRLFAVACCRAVWHLLAEEKSRVAVEVAEDFADGLATAGELEAAYVDSEVDDSFVTFAETLDVPPECIAALASACTAAHAASETADSYVIPHHVAHRVVSALRLASEVPPEAIPELLAAEAPQVEDLAECAAPYAHVLWQAGGSAAAEGTRQCDLLRDIFGNPFRPVAIDRRLVNDKATAVARAIYEEKAFERMPVLADILEEAGVIDADILSHCRDSQLHTRGCHVLDVILQNE